MSPVCLPRHPAVAYLFLVRSMPRTINIGQFYGGLIGAAFWLLVAIWYLYVWPRSLRRRIDRGDIDAFDGLAKLRKAPLIGYFLLLIATADAVGTLDYV